MQSQKIKKKKAVNKSIFKEQIQPIYQMSKIDPTRLKINEENLSTHFPQFQTLNQNSNTIPNYNPNMNILPPMQNFHHNNFNSMNTQLSHNSYNPLYASNSFHNANFTSNPNSLPQNYPTQIPHLWENAKNRSMLNESLLLNQSMNLNNSNFLNQSFINNSSFNVLEKSYLGNNKNEKSIDQFNTQEITQTIKRNGSNRQSSVILKLIGRKF